MRYEGLVSARGRPEGSERQRVPRAEAVAAAAAPLPAPAVSVAVDSTGGTRCRGNGPAGNYAGNCRRNWNSCSCSCAVRVGSKHAMVEMAMEMETADGQNSRFVCFVRLNSIVSDNWSLLFPKQDNGTVRRRPGRERNCWHPPRLSLWPSQASASCSSLSCSRRQPDRPWRSPAALRASCRWRGGRAGLRAGLLAVNHLESVIVHVAEMMHVEHEVKMCCEALHVDEKVIGGNGQTAEAGPVCQIIWARLLARAPLLMD